MSGPNRNPNPHPNPHPNLAPKGSVAKITGKEGLHFTGKALCYDKEEDMLRALENGEIKHGEKSVVIIR